MSSIMTRRGWVQLSPISFTPGTPADQVKADMKQPPYHGPLPSFECIAFIARCNQDHIDYLRRRGDLI